MNFDIFSNPIVFFAAVTAVLILMANLMEDRKPKDKITETRLNKLKGGSAESVYESNKMSLSDKIKLISQDTEQKIEIIRNVLDKLNLSKKIENLLKVAGVKMNIDVFVMLPVIIFAVFFILSILLKSIASTLLLVGVAFAIAPVLIVIIKKVKRLKSFTKQFPDALDLMSSSLRAGHSMMASFQMVVDEMPQPISVIFKVAVDDIQLGIDTKDALTHMTTYMPESVDLRFFVTAVLIQREIGGNLAEVLDSLNYTIRERFKLMGQLDAQTSQAKMSGIVLGLAPIGIGCIINVMNPEYMVPLFNTLIGNIVIGMAACSMITGFFIIKKITNIRI